MKIGWDDIKMRWYDMRIWWEWDDMRIWNDMKMRG